MADTLMLSVGGSPQPLRSAIAAGRWGRLHFIVSVSGDGAASSRAMVESEQINYAPPGQPPQLGPGLRHLPEAPANIAITEVPPDDLDRALALIDAALAAELAAGHHVTVDYTGGTKTMTAALVWAATAHEGVSLQFMAGRRADLRQIEAGSEAPVAMPGELLGLARLFAAARTFTAARNYAAARDTIEDAKRAVDHRRLGKPPRSWNRRIGDWRGWLATLNEWDRFEHRAALERWQRAHDGGEGWADTFAQAGLAERLRRLAQRERGPTPELLEDLWLNAHRRAALGQYDDAVARLYRLAEACVQCRLATEHQIDTGRVDPAKLTAAERERSEPRRDPRTGRDYHVLALTDALGVLARLSPADPVIECWPREPGGRFRAPDWQGGRNRSILAHGFTPLDQRDWQAAAQWFSERRGKLWEQALGRPTAEQLPAILPA